MLPMIMLILSTILSIPEAFDEQKLTTMEHGTCGEPLAPNPHSHALHATITAMVMETIDTSYRQPLPHSTQLVSLADEMG